MTEIVNDQAIGELQRKLAERTAERDELMRQQTATADILKVIAGSPSDVQPVFDAIAERSNRLVNGLSTAVYSIIDDVQHLMAFTPVSPEADAALKGFFPAGLSTFIWGETIRKGQVFRLADTEIELAQPMMREMARLRGWRSFVLVPLLRDDEAIGLISVTWVDPGSFVDHHIQLLKTFADQAVIAIENVRLFDEVQAKTRGLEESLQQQTATADVLKAISRSTFDLRTVLDTLTKSAARLCAADSGVIFQRDGNLCRLAANYGFSTEVVRFAVENPLQLDRGSISGRVILDGKAIHIRDVLTDPEYRATGHQLSAKFRTMLGVPLLREGVTMGSFALTRTEVDPFSKKQIELVTTFADQAVIAIENARLFNEVQERTKELLKSLDDLRAAQDRLIQTEKLASLGQLTAGIAHEIKNPLNFVNNFSALSVELVDEMAELFENPSLGEADRRKELDEIRELLKSNLEKVVQHGKRADSIVSREGSGERRSADINALVGESLNLAYHGARAEKPGFAITLKHDLDPDAGALELYPQEITRALLNLISNGFYAAVGRKAETDDGAFEPVLSAATRNLGETVEIRIRDNGGGIPPDVKEKMFNPFFTTKPTGEGTGLGLSITHDIVVKQHGGRIDVETEPGAFTEFVITLPREKRG
jgi:two-component system, NtrC family, sensor kinase